MGIHIKYPEEERTAAMESELNRFRRHRQRDIAFKELLLEYIAETKKQPEETTVAELMAFSNRLLNSPVAMSMQRLEQIDLPGERQT